MKPATAAIHGHAVMADATGATVVPVYQTVSYAYGTAEELADVFAGSAPGYVYTRMANPTTAALEARLTELENGIGGIATASGMAAIATVALGLLKAGDEIIAGAGLFGGTISLFKNVLGRFGIKTKLTCAAEADDVARAVTDRTRLILVETISNPGMEVPDLRALAGIAERANVPLVVDNTVTTPVLVRPGDFGAAIVVHSTSKFVNGHGTAMGGAIIDTGRFDWAGGPFEDIAARSEKGGRLALLSHLRNGTGRDLGGCAAPMNSHLMLQGLETLSLRMVRHCENARALALLLRDHPAVRRVDYPGLDDSPYRSRTVEQFGGRGGALLTLGLGSQERAFRFINALRLARNVANIGDAKTLVIHLASTIFREFDVETRMRMGVNADTVRVSVGIEDIDDIKGDFECALTKL
ncbi:MAG: O-acetylhomoserine aminocarboxypropyltransferase/cysteine synthase [Sedimentisphaerales bacterium]|nr:O-acetylhomoserine aminocarboxypropyltransferase/cysteine synthase [Sedimentisphaerales bacterium]